MFVSRLLIAAFLLCCLKIGVAADRLVGLVVSVADGDTVTLLTDNKTQLKIRLEGIDAPERSQAFGNVSKQNLAELVFRKKVEANCSKTDKYGRKICRVYIDGLDAGLELLNRGLAWHYKEYAKEQSDSVRDVYSKAEELARLERTGLWIESSAVAPWQFRKGERATIGGSISSPVSGPQPPPPSMVAPVKMSRSSICHTPGSSYYSKISRFTPYSTLDQCLLAGGRLPKQ